MKTKTNHDTPFTKKGVKKILLIMKLTLFLAFITVFQVSATNIFSQGKNISLDMQNVTARDVIQEIELQSGMNFFYNDELFELSTMLNITMLDKPTQEALESALDQAGMTYEVIKDDFVVLLPARVPLQDEPIGVTGTVSDEDGNPLPGVNIIIKGTTQGAISDAEGKYTIQVDDPISILVFSFIGFTTQEIPVDNRTVINIVLSQETTYLSEVVVTSFGIKREKKALSYATQEVEGERLGAVGNTSLVNSLQGKIAGVSVKQISGAPGSVPRIYIRGSRSFTGNNEPLYVVDGLPLSAGGRIIDINPNDIKSINILKGPTAAALYGLRASNGVIVIETNKGEDALAGKPSISFETSYNFDRISRFPETQMTYGQGTNGQFSPYSSFSWGQRIDEMGTYINQLGEPEEAAVYDNDKDLFETGGTSNSNLNISNAFDGGNYGINLGFTNQKGILKNTGLQRINVKFAGGYDLSDKLKVSSSIGYINSEINRAVVPWWATFSVPPSYNLKGNPTHEPGQPYKQINYRGSHDNFYWALDNNSNIEKTSRIIGSMNLDYRPLDWLSINYLLGLDEYSLAINVINELGAAPGRTDPPSAGRIMNSMTNYRQINSNLNMTLNKKVGEDFNVELLLGNEAYDVRTNTGRSSGSDMIIGGFHHISNTAMQSTTTVNGSSRVVGFFSNLSLSWKNSIFLNATGRNDIMSNMPRKNRSFFYPSIGTSIVFTELLTIPGKILSFGKFRVSIAEVGQAGPIYSTETVFVPGSAAGAFTFPFQGLSTFTQSNQVNSSDLRPENTRTYELGVDLRFINNRIGLDYTYYDTKAIDQIYKVPIATSTGFSSELRNSGEMKISGHEITLNIKPIKTAFLLWEFMVNFNTYTNKVISLAEGIEELQLGQGFRVRSVAIEGEEFPSLMGIGYARDPVSGEVVVNGNQSLSDGSENLYYGMPLRSTGEINLGTSKPDFEISIFNNFSYKNFSFAAQLEWLKGGILSSGYTRLGRLYGVLSETENRYDDYVFPGKRGAYVGGELVVEGDNDITIKRGFDFYRRNQDPIRESNIFSATYVRLREVRLSYSLPKAWLGSTFIGSVSFYLVGRNIWLNADLPHFDPEMFNRSDGESYNSYPQNKSFGGGVRMNF